MKLKICYLDFEFRGISEPDLDLVSCAAICFDGSVKVAEKTFWLLGPSSEREEAARFFRGLEGYIFCAYVMEAEARSLLTLLKGDVSWHGSFKAIDLYLEYRNLLNHNHELSYGLQYLKGRVVKTKPPPPKWERDEAYGKKEDDLHHKPSYSLAAAAFKLLNVKIDTKEKDEVRDIIIHATEEEVRACKERILLYNMSDVLYLRPLLKKMLETHLKLGGTGEAFLQAALKRGRYAFLSAKMIKRGYPVNLPRVRKFTSNLAPILSESIEACREFLPGSYVKDRNGCDRMSEATVRAWVEAQNFKTWRLTDGGKSGIKKLSLSKDAFSDFFNSQSPGFGGAFYRHLKTKQSLNGFTPRSQKTSFFDFVGSDGRVRPNFGIYGSQASRSQPGATGFIPLKAHWMRIFLEAPPGKALVGIDYVSQEFLLAAIMSQDKEMIRAYESGDVYLAFGKQAELIPPRGTKATHKKERDLCKTLVLGISYDLSSYGLAPRLSQITGKLWSEEEAQNLIDLFYDIYQDYGDWKAETAKKYREDGYLALCDGWTMWGDNDNFRSVCNFPVQGTGAVIMREAVDLADRAGLNVVFTLHDALYAEIDSGSEEEIIKLKNCMSKAFQSVMQGFGSLQAEIRLEGEVWSRDYETQKPPNVQNVAAICEYIDDKGRSDLKRFAKYL